jgi:hypothetical protein
MENLDQTPYMLRDYCIIHNISLDTNEKRIVGKKISCYCRVKNVAGFKEGDICAIYPAWVLDQYFRDKQEKEETTSLNSLEDLSLLSLETNNKEKNIQTFLDFVQTYLLTQPSTIEELDLVNDNLKILSNRIETVRKNTKICA